MPFKIEGNTLVNYDFYNQEETAVVPEGIEVIDRSAFYVCSKVKRVILPSTLKEIRAGAFRESGIESVAVPDGVTALGSEVFAECGNLTAVSIGKGVERLGDYAFRGCQSLERLELPEGLEKIGYNAFEECYSLKTVWVNGAEYRIRDAKAPGPVRLVYQSLEETRKRIRAYYESGCMDEFEYVDYCIGGDGYDY